MIDNFDQHDGLLYADISQGINDFSSLLKQRVELLRMIVSEIFTELGLENNLEEISSPLDFLSTIQEISNSLEETAPEISKEIRDMINLVGIENENNNSFEPDQENILNKVLLEDLTDHIFIDTMNHKFNNACQGMFFLTCIDTQYEESLNNFRKTVLSYDHFGIKYNIPKEAFGLLKEKFETGAFDEEIAKIIKIKTDNNGVYTQYLDNMMKVTKEIEPIVEEACQNEHVKSELLEIDPNILPMIKMSIENVKNTIKNYKQSFSELARKGRIEIEKNFGCSDKILCCLAENLE